MRVSMSDMSSQAKLGRAKVYKTPGKSPSSDFDREVFLLSSGPVRVSARFQHRIFCSFMDSLRRRAFQFSLPQSERLETSLSIQLEAILFPL